MISYLALAVPAYAAFLFWLLLQAVGAAVQLAGLTAVSGLCHLGGAAGGFAAALLWRGRARRIEARAA
jgi:hypothetical protein